MISVVTTLYRSAAHLREFHARAAAAAGADCEIVLVDDGCPEDSLAVALELHRADPRVVVVELARNAGRHRALMTGLAHARGDLVFLLDCNLEEPPELLRDALARLEADPELDVVYGVPARRRGRWADRLAGRLFYRLLDLCSEHPIPADTGTMRLMHRRYVDAVLLFPERELMIGGVFALAGFRQAALPFRKGEDSATTYDLRRRLNQAVTALTSFSDRPLRAILGLGLAITVVAAAVAVTLTVRRAASDAPIHGYTALMLSIWFLGGLSLLVTGLVGRVLARVFQEAKRRPRFLVRREWGEA